MVGADADELRALAGKLDGSSQQLRGAADRVTAAVRRSPWQGNGADAFRQRWERDGGRSLARAAQRLDELARDVRRQAAEQEQASSVGGGVLTGPTGGPRASGSAFDQRIAQSRDDVQARIGSVKAEISELERTPDGLIESWTKEWLPGVATNNQELEVKRQELARLEGLNADRRQLLMVDSTPDDNRVVEVYGDLGAADRVIIHIPGMNTTLDAYEGDGNVHAINLLRMAQDQSRASGENVAVISFMDYNVPDTNEVAFGRGADAGVAPLRDLVADLHEQGFRTDHLSVVAHSYGSVVAGHTMQEGLDVARVVTVGSPGMATGANDRSDLGSPGVELWAGHATGSPRDFDWVSIAPSHGEEPSEDGFGAHQLPVPGAHGHSSYFKARTESLWNITAVAIGGKPRHG